MAARKPSTKKPAAKRSRSAATKASVVRKPPTRVPPAKKAAATAPNPRPRAEKAGPVAASAPPVAQKAAKKAARKPAAGEPRVERTRVVISMDLYEPNKDVIKAPFREHELKWNFLGEGKGLYKRVDGGVHCFTQFKEDGVHYSIWGADKPRVEAIIASWRKILGEEGWAKATTSGEAAAAVEKAAQESQAQKEWRLAQPQRRAGEPDFFFNKRMAEWQARKPAS